jgi:antitoxin MazE
MNLVIEKGCIELRPIMEPLKGWDEAFSRMHENGDDQLFELKWEKTNT